jgi:protein ImuA
MMSARMSRLATLRGQLARLEMQDGACLTDRAALGHEEADRALQGGLALGAVHEVFAEGSRYSAGATGFVLGLTARVLMQRPLLWIGVDFGEREAGALSMSGLSELGLDPRLMVTVRVSDVESALRTAADALACDALGAVVLEVWGETRHLDLVASRKLTLAAQASRVTGFLLRMAASPRASTAETRWIVRAAHSPPTAPLSAPWSVWGAPVFDAQLVRNRHGPMGRWIMEWKCDECLFAKPAADSQPVAAAPAHRPHQAFARASERRRAG